MSRYSIILFTVGFLFSSEFYILKSENEEILSFEDHCVAYTTREKILFFSDYLVIGKSCNLQVWAEINENKSRFIVSIPAESFDSGISARDDDVMQILDASNHPNIRFETDWLSKVEIKQILLAGKGAVNGVLTLSGRNYSISFDTFFFRKGKNYSIRGTLESNYTFLDLTPPTLGIFFKVLDVLKMVVNLQSDQISGFEKAINLGT